MTEPITVSQRLTNWARYSTIVCCFFIPLSSSLMGGFAILATLLWLLSGQVVKLPKLVLSNTLVFCALALLALLVGGVFYSPLELSEAASYLKKYRELLFFIVTIALFSHSHFVAELAENSFILGCVILLGISFLIYFGIAPPQKYGYSTVYHITHSFFMALLGFWCLQRLLEPGPNRFFWTLLFLATIANLFFVSPGRTGMITLLILILLTIFQRLSFKKSVAATLIAALLVTATYFSSDNFSSRVEEAVHEVQTYQPGASRTSLGMRFDWWYNSITLIKEKPILGHGTGSFRAAQAPLIKGTKTQVSDNPHNEYLFIAIQTGLLGLFFFVTLFILLFLRSFKLQPPNRYLLQGVVVSMAIGCLMNSFLYDSHQGHFYAFLAALLSIPRNVEE